jgi:hypothetical protein
LFRFQLLITRLTFSRATPAIAARSLADLVADHDAPRAVVLADMLAELDQSARQTRPYGQKLVAAIASSVSRKRVASTIRYW